MELVKEKITPKVRQLREWLIYLPLAAFLGFAHLAPGIEPCGLALLCIVPKKARLPSLIGCVVSAFFTGGSVMLSLFCPLYLFFVLYAKGKNGEAPFYTRLLLSFSLSALWGAWVAIGGISDIYGVFTLLAAVIGYPAFTLAFRGFFDRKKEYQRTAYDISLLAFAFALTLTFAPLEISGTSLAIIPGAIFTLIAARTKGFAVGGACGIVCGLVSGGAATGALGVMGMTYGMLVSELDTASLVLSFMLAVTGYFYLGDAQSALVSGVMMLAADAVFLPFRKKLPVFRAQYAVKREKEKSMARYASAFSSLSSLFYTVSDTTKKESITDTNKKICATVDAHCDKCAGCELDRSEISNFFTSEIRRKGVAAYSQIPLHIVRRCPEVHAMAREVNNLSCARAREAESDMKRMAEEYSEVSGLLIEAAKRQEEAAITDREAAKRIKATLSAIGVSCDGVSVSGTRLRSVTVYGVRPGSIKRSPNEISAAISAVTGTRMSEPEFVLNDGYTLLKCETKPRFRVECAKCSSAKDGETVCGDTVSVFENDEKYFYCLVSDGMGSGRDAALTSRLTAIMLEKLLSVGAEKESALKMLNKALLQTRREVFATVDLLEIDRVLSTATLVKAGAAPTLLIHGGSCVKLESKTPPAGIMRSVIAEQKKVRLEKGDMVVMLSDGVLQTGSAQYLLPENGLPPFPSAQALASKLIREAKSVSESDDDMSVCVLRIC